MTDPIYVIGDIHGQLGFLETALDWIDRDGGAAAPLVQIGDLVDRGPDSRAVIDLMLRAREDGRDWIVLKGNHDRMFERYLTAQTLSDANIKSGLTWDHNRLGGLQTLASYGVPLDLPDPQLLWQAARDAVPEAHVAFLRDLPLSHETATHFFAHAGIRPDVPLSEQVEDDLLWIRQEFHRHPGPHPKVIVHGHTPVDLPINYGHRVNTDGGAGYGRPIYPVILEGDATYLLTDTGRARI